MLLSRFVVVIFSVGLMTLGADMVSGQDYPNKPIRIVTGNIGSGNDVQARIIANGISGPLSQPVIIENRGGPVAPYIVSKALPDGYTLVVSGSVIWLEPLLQNNVPWDALRDFSPITLLERSSNVLVVHPSVAARSVKELIALAKAKPGVLTYSRASTGGSSHLAGELFKALAGVKILDVPYKGGAQVAIAVAGNEVSMMFGGGGAVTPHLKTGKVIALAVTGPEPSLLYPGLPTIAATLPGYEMTAWTVALAPAKTPAAIINRLNREIVRVLNQADVKEKFLAIGIEAATNSPQELAAGLKAEIARWGKLIKDVGIRGE